MLDNIVIISLMKFHETSFVEYLEKNTEYNIHPELEPLFERMPKTIEDCFNIILYGPCGVGKYTQALKIISTYSASKLLYEKKISLTTDKYNYNYRMSDIHYEVDMAFLGCNAKLIWNEIIIQITDIIITKPLKTCFIICKNYHVIHKELLENFYSYMQVIKKSGMNIQLYFILLTEHVGFIPSNIIDRSLVISVKRPSQDTISKITGVEYFDNDSDSSIKSNNNLKNIYYNFSNKTDGAVKISGVNVNNVTLPQQSLTEIVCNNIIAEIVNYKFTGGFRDALYDILIYDLDAIECFWYIFTNMVKKNTINVSLLNEDMSSSLYLNLKYHNNNYREIFHIERLFFLFVKNLK